MICNTLSRCLDFKKETLLQNLLSKIVMNLSFLVDLSAHFNERIMTRFQMRSRRWQDQILWFHALSHVSYVWKHIILFLNLIHKFENTFIALSIVNNSLYDSNFSWHKCVIHKFSNGMFSESNWNKHWPPYLTRFL